MLLYIIRHGDPNYEKDCLTERGWQQAEAVGERLERSGIDRVFSSPMGRARETAEPTCRRLGLDCTIEEWAHEIEEERITTYPDGVRKSISAVQNSLFRANGDIDLPYEQTYSARALADTDMRTAMAKIEKEGNAFLERLGYRAENGIYRILRPNEEKVALFCHTCLARAWISTLLHIPVHMMWASFVYTHTGVTALEFKNYEDGTTAPRCLCYSDMSHLYAHGPDMRYNDRLDL